MIVLGALALLFFGLGIKDVVVNNIKLKNAVTVTATIGQPHKQTQQVEYSHSGAGDDIETEVKQISYYTYDLSYSYRGETYELDEKDCNLHYIFGTTWWTSASKKHAYF